MKYHIQIADSYSLISLKAEKLDSLLSPDLKGQLIAVQAQAPDKPLILDLESILFADSSGLSALLMAHRLYRDNDSQCIFCNIQERVKNLLEISQLINVLTTTDTLNEAIKHVSEGDEA